MSNIQDDFESFIRLQKEQMVAVEELANLCEFKPN